MVDGGALEARLRARRDAGRKLLAPYVTAGLDQWLDVVRAFAASGADVIEIGIPFSDPVMDGPTIQAASERALATGANLPEILSGLRDVDVDVPLVVMTYFNLVFHLGVERFAAEAVAAGVSGVILPDVPLEEMGEWEPAALDAGLETVMLASPITPDDRLAKLCARSKGFVYGVNLLGVTGERDIVGRLIGEAGGAAQVRDRPAGADGVRHHHARSGPGGSRGGRRSRGGVVAHADAARRRQPRRARCAAIGVPRGPGLDLSSGVSGDLAER